MAPETRSLLQSQVNNYTIGPTNWDYKEVSVINSLRGDAVTIIVYRRTDGRTDGQTDNGVSHKLDWSRPVELKTIFSKLFHTIYLIYSKLYGDFSLINNMEYMCIITQNDRKCQNASKCLLRNDTESNDTSSYILLDHSNALNLSGGIFLWRTSLPEPILSGEGGGGV